MAVIRAQQTGAGRKWQAIVRKGGHTLSRTFWKQAKAQDWARQVEDAIVSTTASRPFVRTDWLHEAETVPENPVEDGTPHCSWTLSQALQQYADTVTKTKKGHVQEQKRVRQWQARPLAGGRLDALTTEQLQVHVDARVAEGRAAPTVRNEVLLLSALYRHAAQVWKLPLTNPVTAARLPSLPAGRQRRLDDAQDEEAEADEARILTACRDVGGDMLADLVVIAIETGLRQGEILSLTKSVIKQRRGLTTVELPDSKNGHARKVVVTKKAAEILHVRNEGLTDTARLFPLPADTLRHQWTRARVKAGLPGLRFHDLRHESISRMAAAGLTIGELQAQSGHRTAQILLRYVNARPSDIARKLG